MIKTARGPLMVVMLGFVTAIGPLSLDMYLPAFPAISGDLGVGDARVQLTLTACLAGLALGQLACGPLSDRWGRRRPLLIAVTAYAIMSLICAFAPNAELLAVGRLAQGLAGGAGVVVARAVVRDLYAGVAAAKFFSQLSLIFGLAPIAAPLLGSVVLTVTSWRGVFVTLSVIACVLLVLLVARMPETLPAERRSPGGLRDIARTARTLVRDRFFVGYALAQSFAFAGLFSYLSGSSFVLQDGYGVSATVFSLLFGLNSCALIVTSHANSRLLDRFPPRRLLVATLIAQTVAGVITFTSAAAGLFPGLLTGLFILVGTIGLLTPNSTALALDRHPERAGTAAALLGGVQSVIAALATPLVGLGEPGRGVPLGLAILGFALVALASLLTLTRVRRERA
ncbi:multidrug effflux MFS transporter [Actinoplanes sp. NPDC051494]|uniref:multidrug effflux MFS transporter n=1 Tax=Actinoplanes sp. NPDC051494 TaxID=3363907 RepID=UPI0037A05D40